MKKVVATSLYEFLNERDEEPVALAVLGAPAGGKSFTMGKIKDIVDDVGIMRTFKKGKDLTIDKLREEFLSKNSLEQLKGFVRAFYVMKEKVKEDPKEFKKWYQEIINLWTGKFSKLMPELKISINNGNLLFDGKLAYKAIKMLKNINGDKVIHQLDKYQDYKRVVRYFQHIKQAEAVNKMLDISYDEAGDEPKKIVKNLKNLHIKKYVTDVFLIHPKNVASNLIQNFFRVVTGRDGGRDSSNSIIQAYIDIENSKKIYIDNAEEKIKIKSKELEKVAKPIKDATVDDDHYKGNKPIDVFIEVQPMTPNVAYKTFMKKLNKTQQIVFRALLKFSAFSTEGLPENAKRTLLNLTNDMSNENVLKILKKVADSRKFIFKLGGVTPELVQQAKKAFQL